MKYPFFSQNFFRVLIEIASLFIAFSSLAGGLGLILLNGINLPKEWLADSPFSSYAIPGLILFFVIGGTSILSTILHMKKHQYAAEASGGAGFALIMWIYFEIYFTHEAALVQTLYFGLGILLLILTGLFLRAKK